MPTADVGRTVAPGLQFPSLGRVYAHRFHTHPNATGQVNSVELRPSLQREESRELEEALESGSRAEIAREMADVLYVTYGTAWVYDINLDVALAAIHAAAMRKMDVGLRNWRGKIVKPPGFVPPDLTASLAHGRLWGT